MYNVMSNYRDNLAVEIAKDRERLQIFPQGKLKCKRDRQYKKWYRVSDDGKRYYIHKNERETAKLLAEKLLIETRLNANVKELAAVDSYLKGSIDAYSEVEKLLTPDSVYRDLLLDKFVSGEMMVSKWQEAEFETNEGYRENSLYYSPTGNVVRSKSEMMIDMFLSDKGVAYRYESRLELKDGSFMFPDFTFLLNNGRKKYWEHCGMMASVEYVEAFNKKLNLYAANGIYLNENLFVTFETQNAPLQMSDIEMTFEKIIR